MARNYGHEKVDLAHVLAVVEHCGTVTRKALIHWLTGEFDCSERAAADSLATLKRGRWVERLQDSDDGRRSTYAVTERGRYLLAHPKCSLLLRHARKLFTTCPSKRTKRRQAHLGCNGRDSELLRVEALFLATS